MKRQQVMAMPEAEFRQVVSDHLSITAIVSALGFHNHDEVYTAVRDRISDLGIDTSHFRVGGRKPRRYTDLQLADAVAQSRSFRQTLIQLGVRAEGGNYKTIQRDIDRLGLDTSHFTGKGWRKDDRRPMSRRRPLSEVLVSESPVGSSIIRKRLLGEGIKNHQCERCGRIEWCGDPIPLELDHINGVNDDHRLSNLRLICPNCHAQTPTYRGRNVRIKRAREPIQLSIL